MSGDVQMYCSIARWKEIHKATGASMLLSMVYLTNQPVHEKKHLNNLQYAAAAMVETATRQKKNYISVLMPVIYRNKVTAI